MKGKQARIPRNFGLSLLVLSLVLSFGFGSVRPAFSDTQQATPGSFANLAKQVKHSVVNIATTQVIKGNPLSPFMGPGSPFREFFGDEYFQHHFGGIPQGEMKTQALGSGFIIDQKGLILTNNHVIEKASEIKVKLDTGKEYNAEVLGRDPKTDLALIKVKADGDFPQSVPMGDSSATRVGDWVMAVGNPFGLGQTVTVGIISAKGRIIGAGPYDDFLQTDAAINPGNSGGPLFNMQGQVVGINTAIVAQGQGIGFAIPISMARELLPQLESGKVVRGWLGVSIQDLTPSLAKSFNLKDTKGVLVGGVVPQGPADQAGLKAGDIIVRFDGQPTDNAHSLSRLAAMAKPDKSVPVVVLRNGSEQTIQVSIGLMPQQPVEAGSTATKSTSWGLSVQNITPEAASQFGLDSKEKGVVVVAVEPGSPAALAELQPGDVIQPVDRQEVRNRSEYQKALGKTDAKEGLLLLVKRGSGTMFLVLQSGAGE
jgi:serine protease Do